MVLLSSRQKFLQDSCLGLTLLTMLALVSGPKMPEAAELENSSLPPASLKLAKLEAIAPVEMNNVPSTKIEHLSILMVGDTGFAPSRAKP